MVSPGNTLSTPRFGRRYTLHRRLGAGGMGIVYVATDRLSGNRVALKQVRSDAAEAGATIHISTVDAPNTRNLDSAEIALEKRLALVREFQTLASLRHPNIISVLDYGFDDQARPYFTMELLDQPQTILDHAALLPTLAERVDLLIQMLQALDYLYRRRIIHRDLKPGNVLVLRETISLASGAVEQRDQVKVLDFGLAISDQDPTIMGGTLAYVAPEILLGQPATIASDLYAVGTIAYELIAGRHPFDLTNLGTLISDILDTQPDLTPIRGASIRRAREKAPGSIDETEAEHTLAVLPDTENAPDTVILSPNHVIDPLDPPPPRETARLSTLPETKPSEGTQRFRPIKKGWPPPHDVDDDTAPAATPTADQPTAAPPDAPDTAAFATLSAIIGRLLNKNPAARYPDAQTLIRDLSQAVGRPLPLETAAARDSFLQAAQFVGRDREMTQLQAALTQAQNGQGGFWLVSGESGVGKSRLIDELRIRALGNGFFVLRGQSAESATSYQMWREPLRKLALEIELNDADASVLKEVILDIGELLGRPIPDAGHLEPELAQRRLFSVILDMFSRHTGTLLVLLEDVHWASSESLALLARLQIVAIELRLLIVASFREEESHTLPPILQSAQTLKLKRFEPDDIAHLIESMLGTKARKRTEIQELLERETEGNAFFLVEVVRSLAEQAGQLSRIGEMTLPMNVFAGGIKRLIERRLMLIPARFLPILQMAAVFGRQIDLTLLRAALPDVTTEEGLVISAERGILEVQDEKWRFGHDKFREGILSIMTEDQRKMLHRQAAQTIEQVYPNTKEQAVALLYHWTIVGDHDKELTYNVQAGEDAYRTSAFPEAIAYFERSLSLLSEKKGAGTDRQRAGILIQLADVYMPLSNYARATELLGEALTLTDPLTDSSIQAEARYSLAHIAFRQGQHNQAQVLFQESEKLFRDVGDQRGISQALRGLGRISTLTGDYVTAADHLQTSLDISRKVKNEWLEAKALNDLGKVTGMQGEFDQALIELQSSLQIYRRLGNREGIANTLLDIGMVFIFRGENTETRQVLIESLAIFRTIGDDSGTADVLNNLGYVALVQQQYDKAREYFEECVAIYRRVGFQWGLANSLTNLGHVAVQLKLPETQIRNYFREALQGANTLGAVPLMLEIMIGAAHLLEPERPDPQLLRLLSFAYHHPAISPETKAMADKLIARLRTELPSEIAAMAFDPVPADEMEPMVMEALTLLDATVRH